MILIKPRRHPDVAWLELEGEVVIYAPASNLSFVLNPIASVLWQLLDGEHTLTEQFADLAEAVGEDPDTLEAAFGDVLEQWTENDLVVEAP